MITIKKLLPIAQATVSLAPQPARVCKKDKDYLRNVLATKRSLEPTAHYTGISITQIDSSFTEQEGLSVDDSIKANTAYFKMNEGPENVPPFINTYQIGIPMLIDTTVPENHGDGPTTRKRHVAYYIEQKETAELEAHEKRILFSYPQDIGWDISSYHPFVVGSRKLLIHEPVDYIKFNDSTLNTETYKSSIPKMVHSERLNESTNFYYKQLIRRKSERESIMKTLNETLVSLEDKQKQFYTADQKKELFNELLNQLKTNLEYKYPLTTFERETWSEQREFFGFKLKDRDYMVAFEFWECDYYRLSVGLYSKKGEFSKINRKFTNAGYHKNSTWIHKAVEEAEIWGYKEFSSIKSGVMLHLLMTKIQEVLDFEAEYKPLELTK